MQQTSLLERVEFAVILLKQLNQVYRTLKTASKDIEKYSGEFYEKIFVENKSSVQSTIDSYNGNIEKMKQLHTEITSKINTWYEFSKDTTHVKKITYPLKFYMRKKALIKDIQAINEMILNLSVENRFLKEQIIVWEHELEVKALQKIKEGNDYHTYEDQQKKMDKIITELQYLLPTVPGIVPIEIHPENVDPLVEKLLATAAV